MRTPPHTYSMRVFWSDEDEGFIAICPELSNISTFGETAEEAARELNVAIEGAMEVYAQKGVAPPDPIKAHEYSGQLRVRLPKWLHASLSHEADADGTSLNTLIVSKLSASSSTTITSIQRQLASMHEKLDALAPFQTVGDVYEVFNTTTAIAAQRLRSILDASRATWSGTLEVATVKPEPEKNNVVRLVA